jgi:hypothetical protein
MTELRYPLSALFWDYARGIAGMAVCFVILVTNEWQNQLAWLFVGLTVLFAIYTMTTVAKNLTRFRVTEEGIECGGFRKQAIRWADLGDLSLRYYPTSRSRKKGWMSLTLKGGSGKIQIESTLPGFSEIVARAAHAAHANKLPVDRVTADNMAAIGVAG